MENAVLNNYGEVVIRPVDSSPCLGKVPVETTPLVAVIEWRAGINKGVQYDRFGALFVDGFEVLRLTTPEPNGERDIVWETTQDVSDYAKFLFFSGFERTAYLSVPNVVNPTYTGVITANASVVIYEDGSSLGADAMLALDPPMFKDGTNPFGAVGISTNNGNGSAAPDDRTFYRKDTVSFDFPVDRVFLDIYASAHSNEEFFYTNLPGSGPAEGGAYRTLVIFVDDVLAGAHPAFPFIYSGGINPLLWRPLGGIASFSLPPYRIDLTPFAARLSNRRNVTVAVGVVSDDDPDNIWYIDLVALAWQRQDTMDVTELALESSSTYPPNVTVAVNTTTRQDTYITHGKLDYHVRSVVANDNGDETIVQIDATSSNTLTNILKVASQTTSAVMTNSIRTTVTHKAPSTFLTTERRLTPLAAVSSTLIEDEYPIFVDLAINGREEITNITFSRSRSLVLNSDPAVTWTAAISGYGTFQAVNDDADTNASFTIGIDGVPCYDHRAKASSGFITAENGVDNPICNLPYHLRSCGIDLCGVTALPHSANPISFKR